jgi:poly(A) polymerase
VNSQKIVSLPKDDEVFEGAVFVVRILREHGFEAFVVGGAVRDMLMGIGPSEFDIATSATPDDVRRLFRHVVPVGVKYGVVKVRLKRMDEWLEYEVATFRRDLRYLDGRRPEGVVFAGIEEDVRRRDFTVNGLVLDPETGEVFDLVGGLADIQNKIIRAIGSPLERFEEDKLRPLRAIRFACKLGFGIEEGLMEALKACAHKVEVVSKERVRDEIGKVLLSGRADLGLRLMRETGLLPYCLEWFWRMASDKVEETARALKEVSGGQEVVLWASLLFHLGSKGALEEMLGLRHPKKVAQAVSEIVGCAHKAKGLPFRDVAKEKRLIRKVWAKNGVIVLKAYLKVRGESLAPVEYAEQKLAKWQEEDLFPQRLVTGEDALEAGIRPGKDVGKTLRLVEDEILRGKIRAREEALGLLKELARKAR